MLRFEGLSNGTLFHCCYLTQNFTGIPKKSANQTRMEWFHQSDKLQNLISENLSFLVKILSVRFVHSSIVLPVSQWCLKKSKVFAQDFFQADFSGLSLYVEAPSFQPIYFLYKVFVVLLYGHCSIFLSYWFSVSL